MLQADRERQPLQDAVRGLLARLLDVGVDLHRLAVLCRAIASGVGAVRHQHLLHEVGVRQHLLDQRRLLLSLLGELRQALRRGLEQDDVFHELGVQRVAGQELVQLARLRGSRLSGLLRVDLWQLGGEFGPQLLEHAGVARLKFPARLGERRLRHRLFPGCPNA